MPLPMQMVTPDVDGVIREAMAEAMEPMEAARCARSISGGPFDADGISA